MDWLIPVFKRTLCSGFTWMGVILLVGGTAPLLFYARSGRGGDGVSLACLHYVTLPLSLLMFGFGIASAITGEQQERARRASREMDSAAETGRRTS
jgi:hypothetical protein